MSRSIDASRYRCPNVPPVDLDGFAAFAIDPSDFGFCSYTDCRGCTTQRRIRTENLPEPHSGPRAEYFDDRDPEEREVDADFYGGDGAFDWGRSAL